MAQKGTLLDSSFYARDALEVARDLLGQQLWRGGVGLRITETEAYRAEDTACHARFGITERNRVMWGPPGVAYIYFCYGIHHMLNVVTSPDGEPGAVLIRSCEPIAGFSTIQERRGGKFGPVLLTGPGKVAAALDLNRSWNGECFYTKGGLELRADKGVFKRLKGPRVGIEYAKRKDRIAPWRFAIADSTWITQRNNLRGDQKR